MEVVSMMTVMMVRHESNMMITKKTFPCLPNMLAQCPEGFSPDAFGTGCWFWVRN